MLQVTAAALGPALDLVIDTNVVLDWLVFSNPVGAPLERALRSGRCRWLFTRPMRDELAHVMVREETDHHSVLDQARTLLRDDYGIDHATFQVEPEDHPGCEDIAW